MCYDESSKVRGSAGCAVTSNRQKNRNMMVLTAVVFFIPALVGYRAHACPTRARKKILTLNKKAMDDYDLLEFEAAKRTLLQAESVVHAKNCGKHMVAAKTYVNLGVLYIQAFRDRVRGKLAFREALRISPHVKVDRRVATPMARCARS